jgi:hypothetical protein
MDYQLNMTKKERYFMPKAKERSIESTKRFQQVEKRARNKGFDASI